MSARTRNLSIVIIVVGALCSSFAFSQKQQAPLTPEETIHAAIIKPMIQRFERRSMFSRARRVPPNYVLDLAKRLFTDASGDTFRSFEVTTDKRSVVTGCIYTESGDVFLADAKGEVTFFLPSAKHPLTQPDKLVEMLPGVQNAPIKTVAPRQGACEEVDLNI